MSVKLKNHCSITLQYQFSVQCFFSKRHHRPSRTCIILVHIDLLIHVLEPPFRSKLLLPRGHPLRSAKTTSNVCQVFILYMYIRDQDNCRLPPKMILVTILPARSEPVARRKHGMSLVLSQTHVDYLCTPPPICQNHRRFELSIYIRT